MVLGVRKNRMLLLENKLSYIFCVVGAGVTNAEWAWWFVKLHQRCWFAYLCVHFNILPFVLWNLSQLWLGYSFDSGVVGLEINVGYWFWKCNCCLFHYYNLVRPVIPYQWGTLLGNQWPTCCTTPLEFAHSLNDWWAHLVHSDFRLSEPVDCYVNNLKNGVILSYINDEIKIVAIQKSVLYNNGNLVIILSTLFFSRKWQEKKRLSRFCKRYLQYYEIRDLFPREMPTKMIISCLLNVEKI